MSEEKAPHSPAAKPEPMDLETAIRQQILAHDPRYEMAAYVFIYEALAHTQKMLGRDSGAMTPEQRHVSGRELLDGIRDYAAQMFGPLAPVVFRSWRVQRTEDFGEIVFNLVERGLLGKTDSDAREDFAGGFDFDTAFEGPLKAELK